MARARRVRRGRPAMRKGGRPVAKRTMRRGGRARGRRMQYGGVSPTGVNTMPFGTSCPPGMHMMPDGTCMEGAYHGAPTSAGSMRRGGRPVARKMRRGGRSVARRFQAGGGVGTCPGGNYGVDAYGNNICV